MNNSYRATLSMVGLMLALSLTLRRSAARTIDARVAGELAADVTRRALVTVAAERERLFEQLSAIQRADAGSTSVTRRSSGRGL